MIKLVVSDMDATLLEKGKITQRNIDTIHKIQSMGIEFAIASGRDLDGVRSVLDPLGIECSAILGNGAQYVDEKGNILMSCYMERNHYKEIVKIFEDRNIAYMVFTTNGFYSGFDPDFVREQFAIRCHARFNEPIENYNPGGPRDDSPACQIQKIDDVDAFLARKDLEIIKVEAFHYDESVVPPAKDELKDIPGISYLSSFIDNVEVTHKDAQKGLILEKVAELKGLEKEEVAVFGDGMNDITMFEQFPYSFAPYNAEPVIKKMAYKVVSSCADSGFAEGVEYCLQNL